MPGTLACDPKLERAARATVKLELLEKVGLQNYLQSQMDELSS